MRIPGDGFGKTAGWEEIVAQVEDRDASMMGEIVQHQHPALCRAEQVL